MPRHDWRLGRLHARIAAVKALTRRYQTAPRWFYCRDCRDVSRGGELAARMHAVLTGHEVRVPTGEVLIRLTPQPPAETAPPMREQET